MRRILGIILLVSVVMFPLNAFAFGGVAHWEIADRVYGSKYYKSGCLIADIGKPSWDDDYTSSDSRTFSRKLRSLANNSSSTNAKKFGAGWYDHYIQDSKGDVSNISGGPSSYRVKCGWIDEYLVDDQDVQCPGISGGTAYVNYSLIRDTYEALDDFSPTNREIDTEIARMYTAFVVQMKLNTSGWSSSEKRSIEKELNRVADLCNGYSASSSSNSSFEDSTTSANDLPNEELFFGLKGQEEKNFKKRISELAEYTQIDRKELEDGFFEIKFKITQEDKFNQKVEETISEFFEEKINNIEDDGDK